LILSQKKRSAPISRCVEAGFTLLEVLAALAIASAGLIAVSQTISSSIDVSDGTESRMVAYWVADNHLSELRLSNLQPVAGNSTADVRMAGRNWIITQSVKATADPDVLEVDIQVSQKIGKASRLAFLKGYLVAIEPAKDATKQ